MPNFYEMTRILAGGRRDEMFSHGGDVDGRFAMAVYSIMHNKASAVDWDIVDSVPKDRALSWIRGVLADNGVVGEDLEREMSWWRGQIESTGKWN
jgi:hypothetical protein